MAEYLSEVGRKHALALAAEMVRRRILDEGNWHTVQRCAFSRQEYDRLAPGLEEAKDKGFAEGDAQIWRTHFNDALRLEQQLLSTPYARAKAGQAIQTSFDFDGPKSSPDGGGRVVAFDPYKPLDRRAGRR